MKVRAFAEEFGSNRPTIVAFLGVLLVGCVALVSGEWFLAVEFLSLASLMAGARKPAKGESHHQEPAGWSGPLLLAGGMGFLGVACAHAIEGRLGSAAPFGLVGAIAIASIAIDWRRSSR